MNYQDLQQLLNKIDSFEEREREWENLKKRLQELEHGREEQIDKLNEKLDREHENQVKVQKQVVHYHQILEFIPHIIVETDAGGTLEYINKRLVDYTGVEIGEFLKSWQEYFDPQELKSLIHIWKAGIREGGSFKVEHRLKDKKGYFKWFKTEVTPIKGENQEITKWIATGTEIDAERRVIQQLHQTEEQFRFMAEMIPQMVWTALPNGYEDFHNKKFFEYTGLTPSEAEGSGWQTILHPDDLENTLKSWSKVLQTGETYEVEYRFRRHDGAYRWFLGRALPLKNSDGKIIKWFGTSTDINDEKEANIKLKETLEELRTSNNELAHVNNILNNFVYMAAHDLRSPVTNLKTIFDIFKEETEDSKKEEYITLLDKCVSRLDNTVKSLVEVIDVENVNRNIKDVFIQKTLDGVIEDLSTLYPDIKEFVKADLTACPSIRFVEGYMVSIIKNLITNSIKYRSLRRRLEVKVTCQRIDDTVQITIEDNGIGFNVGQHKETIFQPFKRLTHLGEGKGVGLFLVKNIVEKNGGRIEVESTENVGTKFSLYLKEYQN